MFLGVLGHFGRVSCAPDAMIPLCLKAQDVQHPREVVTQDHQAELATALVQAAHQEVVRPGPAFECAEGVLGQLAALLHAPARRCHPQAVPFDGGLVLPAL